jgi:hypothetical protein
MPHGETAYAHVMEFIDGTKWSNLTLERDLPPTDPMTWDLVSSTPNFVSGRALICPQADAMVSSFMALARCGVVQRDVRLQNMIVTSDEAKTIFVVYVDFAKAEQATEKLVIKDADV